MFKISFADYSGAAFGIIDFNDLNGRWLFMNNCDIIFNTVDVKVIEDDDFKKCTASLIVDLSSKGGFNAAAAEENGITAIKAPGLPGKTAPQTAGEILARTVRDILTTNL